MRGSAAASGFQSGAWLHTRQAAAVMWQSTSPGRSGDAQATTLLKGIPTGTLENKHMDRKGRCSNPGVKYAHPPLSSASRLPPTAASRIAQVLTAAESSLGKRYLVVPGVQEEQRGGGLPPSTARSSSARDEHRVRSEAAQTGFQNSTCFLQFGGTCVTWPPWSRPELLLCVLVLRRLGQGDTVGTTRHDCRLDELLPNKQRVSNLRAEKGFPLLRSYIAVFPRVDMQ